MTPNASSSSSIASVAFVASSSKSRRRSWRTEYRFWRLLERGVGRSRDVSCHFGGFIDVMLYVLRTVRVSTEDELRGIEPSWQGTHSRLLGKIPILPGDAKNLHFDMYKDESDEDV